MELDWHHLDRWLMGEAWVGSTIQQRLIHIKKLCQMPQKSVDGLGRSTPVCVRRVKRHNI